MEIEPVHIKLKKDDLAERVLVAGDPGRIRQLSALLEDVRLVSENRGFLIYTGVYEGKSVSLACHGVGAPSAAIVIEELRAYGAKVMLRLGTAGGLRRGQGYGDLVIPTSAASNPGGTLGQYVHDICLAPAPSHELVNAILEAARKRAAKFELGPVYSSDAFYAEDPDMAIRLSSMGFRAIEMECAVLFAISQLRGFSSAALLMISDSLVEHAPMLDAEQMKKYVESASRIALDALTSYEISQRASR
ncbi:MAG: purine-nucleoside phosphorylase [Thermoprotei archaeon]|nr:purine-nucleoside phosphorylase [TACK group archaeon]